jgi:tight adherence protein B
MLMTIIIAILGFVVIMSVGFAFTNSGGGSAALTKRTQAIGVRATQGGKRARSAAKTADDRRKQIVDQLKEAERRERKARLTLSARMRYAGLTPNVTQFWIISGVIAAIVFFVPLVLLSQMPMQYRLLVSIGAAFAAGYGAPRWVLSFMAQGRVKKFALEFPNAMDILVRGIKSGLPVHDGFKIIAKESPAPVGPEFQRMVENVGVGMSLEGALEKMCERITSPELRFFAIVIAIQQKTGGNLAEALNNLSTVLRARKMMGEKIKALSSEALASASIIGCLPPGVMIMIFLSRPAYISVMFSDVRGQMMLLAGAVWMGLGVLSMRKMINFKF